MKIALATPCGTPWWAVTGVEAACTIALAFMLKAIPVIVLASDSWPTALAVAVVDGAPQVGADHADRADVDRVEQRIGADVHVGLDRVRERVGAGRRDDVRRRGEHELRIDDRDPGGEVARRRRRP